MGTSTIYLRLHFKWTVFVHLATGNPWAFSLGWWRTESRAGRFSNLLYLVPTELVDTEEDNFCKGRHLNVLIKFRTLQHPVLPQQHNGQRDERAGCRRRDMFLTTLAIYRDNWFVDKSILLQMARHAKSNASLAPGCLLAARNRGTLRKSAKQPKRVPYTFS